MTKRFAVVPLDLAEANQAVAAWHRHHAPAVGHRFSIGLVGDDGGLHGAAIIGRPVARNTDQRYVAEVLRVATDGTRNACSMLLGAAARAAKAMGYARIQTFTLPEEGGASLRATGWQMEGITPGGDWLSVSRTNRRQDQPQGSKYRWVLDFHSDTKPVTVPNDSSLPETLPLFGGVS